MKPRIREALRRHRRVGVTADDPAGQDWIAWHAAYDDDSPLQHQLPAVQARIREALLERPPGPTRVISACAGDRVRRTGGLRMERRRPPVRGRSRADRPRCRLFTFATAAAGGS
jgi:hypothetical protein